MIGIDGSAKPARDPRAGRADRPEHRRLIGVGRELRDDEIVLDERYHAGTYGIPDERTLEAMRLAGRLEGMITDPVYEGKSMAGLIDLVSRGEIGPRRDRALRPPRRPARAERLRRAVHRVAGGPPVSSRSAARNRPFCAGVPYVTRSAPGFPNAPPARTSTPRPPARGRPLPRRRGLLAVGTGRSNHAKFACDSADAMPIYARASCISTRATTARSTRSVTSSWCLSASIAAACAAALQKNGWRTWLTARTKSSVPQSA